MKKILLLNSFIVLALLMCTGCASIVSGISSGTIKKKVHINSNPAGATVTITDGIDTITTKTPAVVKLSRDKGYFQGQHYTVKFDLDGYYPYELQLDPRINPWYFGNIAIGGLIGLVIVDPLTGDMWTLHPDNINWNLISKSENLTPEQLQAREAEMNQPKKPEKTTTAPKDTK